MADGLEGGWRVHLGMRAQARPALGSIPLARKHVRAERRRTARIGARQYLQSVACVESAGLGLAAASEVGRLSAVEAVPKPGRLRL